MAIRIISLPLFGKSIWLRIESLQLFFVINFSVKLLELVKLDLLPGATSAHFVRHEEEIFLFILILYWRPRDRFIIRNRIDNKVRQISRCRASNLLQSWLRQLVLSHWHRIYSFIKCIAYVMINWIFWLITLKSIHVCIGKNLAISLSRVDWFTLRSNSWSIRSIYRIW